MQGWDGDSLFSVLSLKSFQLTLIALDAAMELVRCISIEFAYSRHHCESVAVEMSG